MKAIIILLMVSGILLSGCSAEVPSLPQIPESSEPSSDKEPSSLPISPQPSKIAHFNISLIRYEGTITNGVTLRLAGEVRNDSITPLKHVVAIITSYDGQDNIIGTKERHINREVLYPGETSVFSVTFNKRWTTEYCKVSFRLSRGEDILELSIDPDVPTKLYVPYIAESGLVRLLGAKHFDISLVRYGGTIWRGVVLLLGGEVRNDSTTPLKHVVGVITSYDANDNIIGIDERLINCEVLHPAETCVFSVTFNKRWGTEYCKVSFRLSEGDDILKLSREPDVPTSLDVPYKAGEEIVTLEKNK